uniref:Uncharacterized protein n=1 Tax=Candidatus Methanogaster sp. ANME-2c ERB4 TaxID=2759911 RepID=A0A7G9YMD4_9EURY|nr:hypothetical protein CDCKMDEO_00013 [Methanosarcinales archaeon ANME-2c ERB4]
MGGDVKWSGTQECGKTELFVDDTTDFFHENGSSLLCMGNTITHSAKGDIGAEERSWNKTGRTKPQRVQRVTERGNLF